jgi:hypothetical protein
MKITEFRKLIREEIENVLGKNINESSINTYYKDLIIQQINKRLFNIFDRDGMMESEYQDLQNYLKMLDDKLSKNQTNKYSNTPFPKIKDEYGNTDWRDTGEMGG